jgi:hypothetical protein
MRRIVVTLVALACLVPAQSAAQDDGNVFSVIIGFGPGFRERTRANMDVRFEGSVVVRYSGRGESGTIVWTPGQRGQFTVAEGLDRSGRRLYQAWLGGTGGQAVVARVARGDHVCTDRKSAILDGAFIRGKRDGLDLALTGSGRAVGFSLTETDCGGPLSGSLAQVLRPVTVSAADLRRGRFDVDLRASGPFADGPLKGTVESTVVAHIGRAQRERQQPEPMPRRPRPLYRNLSVRYRIERVSGQIAASFRPGELCDELASCGGTAGWSLQVAGRGSVYLQASAPATRSESDLRAATGLRPSGDPRGIQVFGGGEWTGNTSFTATATVPGEEPCTDSRRIGGSGLRLEPSGSFIEITALGGLGMTRTSCPGPAMSDDPTNPSVIASGRVPLAAFAHDRVRVALSRGTPIESDGWTGATKPDLTFVLKRVRVSTRVERF